MEFILYLVIGFVAYRIGWLAREYHAVSSLENMLSGMESKETGPAIDAIPILIEKHKGVFYAYNNQDKTFMAQGNTRKNLEENLDKRYPGKKFAALPSNMKDIGF